MRGHHAARAPVEARPVESLIEEPPLCRGRRHRGTPLGHRGRAAPNASRKPTVPQLYFLSSLGRRSERLPPLRDALWAAEAAVLERLTRAVTAGDPDAASDLGARLGRLAGPRLRKHRHVLANLRMAFPRLPPHRLEAMASDVWGSIGRTLVEHGLLDRIGDPAEGRVRLVDMGGLEAVRGSGRPGVFVSAHLGNWNLLPLLAARTSVPLAVVYRQQTNPRIERLLQGWRSTPGCRFLEVKEASRALPRELRQGRSVGLLIDQRYDRGELIPFFGAPAYTTVVPARLACRLGLPLVPVQVERRRGASFVVTVHRPVPRDPGLDDEEAAARAMTARVNELFARWIVARPDQWVCAKRRWPRMREFRSRELPA
jgi:Kdo2-lipid IVA lauroyltransferase/acyltransferase